MPEPTVTELLEAFTQARYNAASAIAVEQRILYDLVRTGHAQGHSTRDLARTLDVPKSSIARILKRRQPPPIPTRATPVAYVAAHNDAFTDHNHHITRAPFTLHHDPETNTIRVITT